MVLVIEAFRAQDVRAAEAPLLAAERGFSGGLMHRAATALDLAVRRELRSGAGRVAGATVVALVGPGNNGGDALHALAGLARRGVRAVAVLSSARVHEGGLAALVAAGGTVLAVVDDAPGRRVWLGDAAAEAFAAEVVLDGLLGIGASGGLRGAAAELVEVLDGLLGDRSAPPLAARPLVVAVDVPSGVGVDDGAVTGPVLRADRTVTFGVAKPALLLPPAAHLAGVVEVVDLGLAAGLGGAGAAPHAARLEASDVAGLWPVPAPGDDKYRRGVVGVVAGTATYPGAAVLTVAGAQGAGCGMVRYVGPDAVRHAVVTAHPEAVTGSTTDVRVQAWVLGPGVADDDAQSGRIRDALAHAVDAGVPAVVDAGGLEHLPTRLVPTVVLTPHAGELARLLATRGEHVGREDVEAEPARWARAAALATGATVLLKGHVTVAARPDASAPLLAQQDAPAWLATAGAGDVLAGVLGALLAGRADDVRTDPALVALLAAAAALVHGRAAGAAGPGPVTAGGVARALPGVVAELLAVAPPAPTPPAARRHRHLRVHHAPRRVVR